MFIFIFNICHQQRIKPAAVLQLSLLDHVTQGSTGSMAETPFEYTSSDEEEGVSCRANPDTDRTKRLLSVRISDVVDVNLYRNDPPDGDDGSLEEGDEEDVNSISSDENMKEDKDEPPESHYDIPRSVSREHKVSESDSVFTEDSIAPEVTIDGKTIEDCIAMMDDGTMSIASHGSASDDEGFAKRSKSFLNLFFGSGNVCIVE